MIARPDRRALVAFGAVFVALALAACSSSPAASSAAAVVTAAPSASAAAAASAASASSGTTAGADACALLPVADVEAAFGVSGLTPTSGTLGTASGCVYQTADGTAVAATTYVKDGGAVFDAYKSDQGAIQIPGVADGAYLYDSNLYVKKGDSSLIFKVSSPEDFTPQKIQEIATAIAKALASHL